MSRYSTDFIAIADLYLAYRKAKVEAFYETTHHHALAFVEYERDLHRNLQSLLTHLTDGLAFWASDPKFVGSFIDAPRNVSEFPDGDMVHFHAVDPLEDWERRFNICGNKRATATFRMLIVPTVNMQIVSALWILKAGYRFDFKVDREHSFGNRLRGIAPSMFDEDQEPKLNRDCIGLFVPYFSAYREWRENGLRAMQTALEENKRIVAITMDIRQFYHRTSPAFLLRDEFLRAIDLEMTHDQSRFTADILSAITAWYKSTPDYSRRSSGALPVGLSASKIISNVLLCEFDRALVGFLKPVYYGRYVDDIFLVFEPKQELTSGSEVLRYIVKKCKGMLSLESTKSKAPNLRLHLPYAKDSDLVFASEKQKIFYLHSEHGLDLIEQISEQIRRQSSEYRLLEELPDSSAEMAARALLATPDATLEADALRKADKVSVRRLGFALLLRDVEAYARDLSPGAWRYVRNEFYGLVRRHLLTPKGYFDYMSYLHRVFGLMVACGDFQEAHNFLARFVDLVKLIRRTTTAGAKESKRFRLSQEYYLQAFLQSALQASTVPNFRIERPYRVLIKHLRSLTSTAPVPETGAQLLIRSQQILNSDWGRRPYKDYWYYSHRENAKVPPVPKARAIRKVLRLASIRRFRKLADLRVPFWPALAFPTRPLSVPEITLVAPIVLQNHNLLRMSIMGLRGAKVATDSILGNEIESLLYSETTKSKDPSPLQPPLVHIPWEKRKVRLAVTSMETTVKQWTGALHGRHDRTLRRYRRLTTLVNRILQERPKPDYVAFPECSLPRRWALRISQKLALNGISLLGGIEYYKKRGKYRNDCLLALTTNWPGYRSYILRMQPKLVPAHNEAEELKKAHASLHEPIGNDAVLPIYVHGAFCFGVLLCSDLTNIQNRRYFQGQVDALFVLEWNPDVATFSFLVEATAHDVHAFVVQVNNRLYGDSRIRVPYRLDHQRDAVRVKGGVTDYYVVADIDFWPLRAYQARRHPPKKGLFKPVPIGFRMSPLRKKETASPE